MRFALSLLRFPLAMVGGMFDLVPKITPNLQLFSLVNHRMQIYSERS